MASLPFFDNGSRLVLDPNGRPAKNRVGVLYLDLALTTLAPVFADLAGTPGAQLAGSAVTTDAYGYLPRILGPTDGTDRLYISVNGGPAWPVDADNNARLDALTTRVDGIVAGGGGAVSSVAGKTGVVTLTASDVSGVETPSGAQAKATAAQNASDPAGAAAAAVTAHVGATDPHGDRAAATAALSGHTAATTSVHGIANTAALVLTSDSRLTDARTPTGHAASHASGGSDAVTVAQSQVTGLSGALAGKQDADTDLTALAALDSAQAGAIASDGAGWVRKTYAQLKTALGLVKGDVGLGNVDNTADTAKPVSTAQATAIGLKLDKASNLSDLAAPATARTNLGLGGAATLNVGTTTGTVAAGDDSRFAGGVTLAATTPAAESAGATGTVGVGTTAARADHVHALPAFGTATGTFAQGNDSRIINAGQRLATTATKTGAYTAGANELIPADATTTGFTVTLPAAATVGAGAVVVVQKVDATTNVVTVARGGTDTINAAATTVSVVLGGEASTFVSDGISKWMLSAGQKTLASLDARFVKHSELVFNIRDYGAVGNGVIGTSTSADGTGTDDTVAINAAITAANAAGGGTVIIPPSSGAYVYYGIVLLDNVALVGHGGKLILKSGVFTNGAGSYYGIRANNRTNVQLRNLYVDGNGANNTVFAVADAITVSGENILIDGVTVINPADSGIMFTACTNSALVNSRVDNGTDVGFYVNDGAGGAAFAENVISGNRITNCPNGGIALKRNLQRVTVADNQIYNCGWGITLEHGTGTDFSTNVTLIGNRLRHIGYIGTGTGRSIELRGCDYVVCIGNRVEDSKDVPIALTSARYSVVTGNVVDMAAGTSTASRAGIWVADRGAPFAYSSSRNVISGNVVRAATGPGIQVTGTSTNAAVANTIANNQVIAAGTYGVQIDQYTSGTTVSNNTLEGATADAYAHASAGPVYPTGNRLINGTTSGPFLQAGGGDLQTILANAGITDGTGAKLLSGSGSPEGVVTAGVGAVYQRTDGGAATTLYAKEAGAGNTGWVPYGAARSDVQVFTASGTWTKPAWATKVDVACVAGGAGAGSGAINAAGTARGGGGGGGGGGMSVRTFVASDLTGTVAVTVGAGGAGGAAQTGTAAGNGGTAGGQSTFGAYLWARGGALGPGGGLAAASTGGVGGGGTIPGASAGSGSATGAQGSGGGISNGGAGAGGGGGGLTTGNAESTGGTGVGSSTVALAVGTAGAVGGGAGGNGAAAQTNMALAGAGGGGGGSSATNTVNGGAGGAGAIYGAGGGGGGAATSGSTALSGAGGAGAAGIVVVISQ